ncbi:hypothetical protein [Brevundimonas sp.]|uniref:DUF6968 family protein n=1 Tax=Brevundimonas sp. TaxID=1871086 RepID=UPI0027310AF9|nr:hypothetical protein [Brevundimonas sp.]MDP1913269.1 hypothetical protein [Brevundimonas sp.]
MTGEVICEREFNTVIDGETFPIVVRWMKPTPDHSDWRCEYSIAWPDASVRRGYAMGVDSTQALILAFHPVSTDLELAPWPVRWFDNEVNDLGLPGFRDPETRTRVITSRGMLRP